MNSFTRPPDSGHLQIAYSFCADPKVSAIQRFYCIKKYSTHDEGKCVIAGKLIRIDKLEKLDDTVSKYGKTYHNTMKMKPVDVKSNTYIDFNKEINYKNPKFEIADFVRIPNIKIFFQKVLWTFNVSGLKGEETFYKIEL